MPYGLLSVSNSQPERQAVSVILKVDLLRYHRIYLLLIEVIFGFWDVLIKDEFT